MGKILKPTKRPHNPSGFTLIELMVVVIIIGIILLLVVPNFAQMQRKARIRAGAQAIAQDFRQIRERALSVSQEFEIVSPNDRQYEVRNPLGDTIRYKLGQTTGGNLRFATTGGVPQAPGGNGPPPIGGWDFPGGSLKFRGRGDATNGVVYITDGSNNFAIHVNSLGNVKVYRYENGSWTGI